MGMRNKFMFFENFKATADKLNPEQRLAFYDAITNYVFYDIEPEDPIISALLEAIKPSLNKTDGREKNGGNHNISGKNQYSEEKKELVNSGQFRSKLVNSGQSLIETETETETKKREYREKSFCPPTLEEVLEYAKGQNEMAGLGGFRCSRKTAESFWSNYESNGWVLGNESRTPIRDWKAKLRQWSIKDGVNSGVDEVVMPKRAGGEK